MSIVALIYCNSYDYNLVLQAVIRGVEMLGGIRRFVSPGEKILLKPNLLTAADPNKCITTHPHVFKAIAEILKANNIEVSYGDNPGVISFFSVAKKSGIAEVASQLKIKPGNFNDSREFFFTEGTQNKLFTIVDAIFENDGIISLPKFKTHSLTKITGSVKNQFGCIPFFHKRVLHAKLSNPENFSRMLLDLNQCIKPRLYIMDAIQAMEGEGPVAGKPRKLNLLAISNDPIALDATMCRIISINPESVATIFFGQKFGYGKYVESEIELKGDNIGQFITTDFKLSTGYSINKNEPNLSGRLINTLARRPQIIKEKCTGCGTCVKVCPVSPKALSLVPGQKYPEYDPTNCIRCYCCHELCTHRSIRLVLPLINSITR